MMEWAFTIRKFRDFSNLPIIDLKIIRMLEINSNSITDQKAAEVIQKARALAALEDSRVQIPRSDSPDRQKLPSNVKTYPEPNMSGKKYDPITGYYFDDSTGLYYEPKSRYFYNPVNQKFLSYDTNLRTYVMAPDNIQKLAKSVKNECEDQLVVMSKPIGANVNPTGISFNDSSSTLNLQTSNSKQQIQIL